MSPQLSLDIHMEIIKKLPVKSLIQFRSVCKAWKSLIDSSQFITGYNFRHHRSEHLLVMYEVGKESKLKYVSVVDDDTFPQQKFAPTVPPILQLLDKSRIIGSSCGLLCFSGLFGEPDGSETKMVVLWNPSIIKWIDIVVPNEVHLLSDSVIGFGVCPDTKDPKIVRITYTKTYCIEVMVFTSSSGEWTCLCSNQLPRKSIEFTYPQIVIGQFIYWLANDWSVVDGEWLSLIMSFDLSTYEFREIDLPDCMVDPRGSDFSISVLRESLAVVEYHEVCDVWMMEDGDSKAFTKLFTINPPNASVSQVLGFRKSGEPIIEMRDDNEDFYGPREFAIYEPCSEHTKELGICGNKCSFLASSYTESLFLLDHDDGHVVKSGALKR